MIDRDLAEMYEVDIKRLNEQVKRNKDRFPKEFMFQLSKEEFNHLRSQFATTSWGGRRYAPYAFTEQGVSMLSAVLHSKRAVEVSILIINAFVQMRRFLLSNQDTFKRLHIVETKLLEHDSHFTEIFKKLNNNEFSKGIFFEGQFFDSHEFLSKLIRNAKTEIILIDNYVDERTLALFQKTNVPVTIYTSKITTELKSDLEKYNSQYNPTTIKKFTKSHDRFLIIDDETYHIGSSLKDVGKKWFAFSKIDITTQIKSRLD